jgi:hypothetical protein
MTTEGRFRYIGQQRTRKGPGRCGLCGQYREMTEAHVPPQAVGNNGKRVERTSWVQSDTGARLGSWKPGGLTVYGLCHDCNHLTSGADDPAYIAFHNEVQKYSSPGAQRLLINPQALPATVSPGLVARSVLAGKFALNDRLQEHFPHLATGLRLRRPDLRLPDELTLRLALYQGTQARIGGPVSFMRVLNRREVHSPFADIWFPPMAWCLVSSRPGPVQLGPEISATWADVSDWIRYSPQTAVDLRTLVGPMRPARPPQFGGQDWAVLLGDSMAAVEGRIRA